MAKESMKARERKRRRMVEKYAAKRAALKAAGEWDKLQQLPANSSYVRLHNRCPDHRQAQGYVRLFGISRNMLRQMALEGKIPGVTKSSW